MSKDPFDKILCAIIPHPDAKKGLVQKLENEGDWSQFDYDIRNDVVEGGKPVKVVFREYTRSYVKSLPEFD